MSARLRRRYLVLEQRQQSSNHRGSRPPWRRARTRGTGKIFVGEPEPLEELASVVVTQAPSAGGGRPPGPGAGADSDSGEDEREQAPELSARTRTNTHNEQNDTNIIRVYFTVSLCNRKMARRRPGSAGAAPLAWGPPVLPLISTRSTSWASTKRPPGREGVYRSSDLDKHLAIETGAPRRYQRITMRRWRRRRVVCGARSRRRPSRCYLAGAGRRNAGFARTGASCDHCAVGSAG